MARRRANRTAAPAAAADAPVHVAAPGAFPGRIFRQTRGGLFAPWTILALPAGFVALLFLLNRAARSVCVYPTHDCLPSWPVSIFEPLAPGAWQIGMAAASLLLFGVLLFLLSRTRFALAAVLAAGFALCLATSAIQGLERGFEDPQTFGGVQYYHEAVRHVDDPWSFFRHYEALQSNGGLWLHGNTHPPGATLSHWLLVQAVGESPLLVSLAVALVGLPLLGFFFHGILRTQGFAPEDAGRWTFLLLLVPSVQVYGLATLDLWIAATATGALYFFLQEKESTRIVGTLACLVATASMTFMAVFLLPVLLLFDLARRHHVRDAGRVVVGFLGVLLLAALLGYNWLHSLQLASRHENPAGFLLVADPLSYFFTRIEDWLDVLVFLGPFLGLLAVRGMKRWSDHGRAAWGRRARRSAAWTSDLGILTGAALLTITLLFAAGAYRTGETARAALFLVPILLFPVVELLREERPSSTQVHLLFTLVFLQTVVMQAAGTYVW